MQEPPRRRLVGASRESLARSHCHAGRWHAAGLHRQAQEDAVSSPSQSGLQPPQDSPGSPQLCTLQTPCLGMLPHAAGCDTGLQGHGPVLPLRAPPGRVAGASSLLRGTDDTALNTAQGALRLFGHCSAPLTPIHSGPPWAPAQSLLRSWAVGFPFLVEGGPDGSANERVHFCAPRTSHLEGQLGERRLRAAVEPDAGACPAPTARARRDHWGPR